MSQVLTVVSDFGDYRRGDQITDSAKVDEILASDHHPKVVASHVPDPKPVVAEPTAEPAAQA